MKTLTKAEFDDFVEQACEKSRVNQYHIIAILKDFLTVTESQQILTISEIKSVFNWLKEGFSLNGMYDWDRKELGIFLQLPEIYALYETIQAAKHTEKHFSAKLKDLGKSYFNMRAAEAVIEEQDETL